MAEDEAKSEKASENKQIQWGEMVHQVRECLAQADAMVGKWEKLFIGA